MIILAGGLFGHQIRSVLVDKKGLQGEFPFHIKNFNSSNTPTFGHVHIDPLSYFNHARRTIRGKSQIGCVDFLVVKYFFEAHFPGNFELGDELAEGPLCLFTYSPTHRYS